MLLVHFIQKTRTFLMLIDMYYVFCLQSVPETQLSPEKKEFLVK